MWKLKSFNEIVQGKSPATSIKCIAPRFPAEYRVHFGEHVSEKELCCRGQRYVRNLASEFAMGTILLIIVVLLVIGALPTWPYSSGWGYYPSSGLGLVLVILVLVLTGRV
jgi:hypothetical protein